MSYFIVNFRNVYLLILFKVEHNYIKRSIFFRNQIHQFVLHYTKHKGLSAAGLCEYSYTFAQATCLSQVIKTELRAVTNVT
jgi:hypothetical protein